MKTNGNDFKNWMNHGTQIQILIRRIMIIGLIALMIYGTGYAIGTFIAHLGFYRWRYGICYFHHVYYYLHHLLIK